MNAKALPTILGGVVLSIAGNASAADLPVIRYAQGQFSGGMSKLAFAARNFYGPRHRMFFRIASISRRAQELGVDWYNGARHLDEVPTRRLVARWARAVLLGEPLR